MAAHTDGLHEDDRWRNKLHICEGAGSGIMPGYPWHRADPIMTSPSRRL